MALYQGSKNISGGKSAYESAKDAGYQGTPDEFNVMLANLETNLDNKAESDHNHDSLYDVKGASDLALASATAYVDAAIAEQADKNHNHQITDIDSLQSALDAKSDISHGHTATEVGADPAGTSNTVVSAHNTNVEAHNDIRVLISDLTERLNGIADSDDITLDQLSEIVAYIKNNKSLIDGVTTSKVNVDDIIDNLTTNVTNKPLSAAQGVAIKALIDALDASLDEHNINTAAHADIRTTITTLGTEVDNKLAGKANTSHGNHVPTPETANNSKFLRNDNTWQTVTPANIGAATSGHTHTASDIGAVPTYRTVNNNPLSANITLTAADVGARPSTWMPTAADVGAAASSHNHAASNITSGTLSVDRLPTVTVAKGGTGATDAATARTNLGITPANIGAVKKSGDTITGNLTVNGTITGTTVKGSVWNDYAEYREADTLEPGRVVCENGDDTLSLSSERLQAGANIISDTFGFSIGETESAMTPIAVAGRVLAYPFEDRDSYKPGDAVCSAPNGTVSKMTREEIREYPDRIVGTVSSVPQYETWGTGNVPVNGRIWIKVK